MDNLAKQTRARPTRLIGAATLLMIVLAAAGYEAGLWLNRTPTASQVGPANSIQWAFSKDLPDTPMDERGVLVRRQDHSFFIGTVHAAIDSGRKGGSGSSGQASVSYEGPVVEVVVTHDTQVLKDESVLPSKEDLMSGKTSSTVEQVIRPGSLDEVPEPSIISVWGERRGDRITARVFVYRAW